MAVKNNASLLSNPVIIYGVDRDEKALLPQRMCTCAAGKGHEKSQRLIRVSAADYVMVNIQFDDPDKLEFILSYHVLPS